MCSRRVYFCLGKYNLGQVCWDCGGSAVNSPHYSCLSDLNDNSREMGGKGQLQFPFIDLFMVILCEYHRDPTLGFSLSPAVMLKLGEARHYPASCTVRRFSNSGYVPRGPRLPAPGDGETKARQQAKPAAASIYSSGREAVRYGWTWVASVSLETGHKLRQVADTACSKAAMTNHCSPPAQPLTLPRCQRVTCGNIGFHACSRNGRLGWVGLYQRRPWW